jgi:hypothetical protein
VQLKAKTFEGHEVLSLEACDDAFLEIMNFLLHEYSAIQEAQEGYPFTDIGSIYLSKMLLFL